MGAGRRCDILGPDRRPLPARTLLTEPTSQISVFLSAGRASSPKQKAFVEEVERFFLDNGLRLRTVGRTEFTSGRPLERIMDIMNHSAGTVVIAFERSVVERGLEHGKIGDEPRDLSGSRYPTVWNQVEAALAYALGHPLLVIVEHGLRSEGLLESGYDWYVQRVELREGITEDEEFVGVFQDWRGRVDARARSFYVDEAERR